MLGHQARLDLAGDPQLGVAYGVMLLAFADDEDSRLLLAPDAAAALRALLQVLHIFNLSYIT